MRWRTRIAGGLAGLALTLVGVAAVPTAHAAARTAREVAMQAFHAVERAPFDELRAAAAGVVEAAKLDPKEPWVYVAAARVQLRSGYRSGDAYDASTYDPDAIAAAQASAKRAVELGPKLIAAHNEAARIRIILRDFAGAADALREANTADANNEDKDFLAMYLSAQLSRVQRAFPYAVREFGEAEKRAKYPYQRKHVASARVDLAYAMGDAEAAERFHKQVIELDPESAHAYGNYGHFLLWRKRYDEAVTQLEKAVAIRPYGAAMDDLKRARLMRDAAKKK